MARTLRLSLLFFLFAPVIKVQETVLQKAFRLILLCLFIVSFSTTVSAPQRILRQGRVSPEQINVSTMFRSQPVATTLKQNDVVDVVLAIQPCEFAGVVPKS